MSDLTLLEEWTARRDAQAFRALVLQYGPMVFGTCRRILGNGTEAEDVTQECFEVLAQARRRPAEHLGAWLHRVATNRALDRIRSERRRKQREARFATEQPSQAEPAWDDIYDRLDEAVAELPEELRVPVVAHYLLGQSHGEIARATGVARRTVSYRIERGVEQLGESLRRRGIHIASGVLGTLMAAHLAEAATVPAPLIASLGMLALAHSANTAGTATKILGGMLIMKKAALGAFALAAIVAGILFLATRQDEGHRGPAAQSGAAMPGEAGSETAAAATDAAAKDASSSAEAGADGPAGVPDGAASKITSGIFGTVVDEETGAGVAGVTVFAGSARWDRGKVRECVSDAEGNFEIEKLAGGNYFVYKDTGPDDYAASSEQDVLQVRLKADERREGLRLVARKGGTITGVVTNGEGNPVSGASLEVSPATNESWKGLKAGYGGAVSGKAESDASGRFAIRGVKMDRQLIVVAKATGCAPVISEPFELTRANPARDISLLLSAGSTIAGRVVDRQGEPKPNTGITLEPKFDDNSVPDYVLKRAGQENAKGLTSDASGGFRIEGLPAGTYSLFAGKLRSSKYGWQAEGASTTVDVDGIHAVDGLVLTVDSLKRGEHSITGRVTSTRQEPIANALVDLMAMQEPSDHVVTDTDKQGRFEIAGLGTGNYIIAVTAAGYAQGVLDGVGVDGPELAIELEENAAIRGHVYAGDTRKPLGGATVGINRHDGLSSDEIPVIVVEVLGYVRRDICGQEWTVTAEDGSFELPGVEPGTVQLKATRSGYAQGLSGKIKVRPGRAIEDVEVYCGRGAAIEGTVTDTAGVPVEGASILLIPAVLPGETALDTHLRLVRATNDDVGGPDVLAVADAAGAFRIEGVADGEYCMRALATGYAYSAVSQVRVANGASQSGCALVVDAGGTLEGFVYEDNEPQTGVRVEILYDGPSASCQIVYTDSEGHYVGRHLVPGEHQLRVVHTERTGGDAVKAMLVSISSGKVTRQDVHYGGNVAQGTVDGLSEPETWSVAILEIPAGVDPEAPPDPSINWQDYVISTARIGSDNHYSVGDLPEGTYKLALFRIRDGHLEVKSLWQTITIEGEDLALDVAAGENLPVDIRVPD